ncbi:ABC transporter permease [Aureimonas jatrophae]|uniref:Ribose transport system permease protein n=1 Tax=Aureimonas jatrophae TaxID=1166073 RepID=A0A1H0F900_9HYPH|nr:ABC transporter permease [Aureimonas jatrophae]MBB3950125.1 ribose transport system permease protein [Aureimonas jatrophae]SDN91041.1 ribose transport system permease protein [Aureimonas jatrophae]
MSPRLLRALLPPVSLVLILAVIFLIQPRAMSYLGLNLMLNLALPIALATIAQLCVITVNDLDLSIGAFVSLVACVGATLLPATPLLGTGVLLALIAVYAGLGALIHWRDLPSIVVTLGMSFVWLGLAVLLLPSPGGSAPAWLSGLVKLKTPVVPFAILASAALALLVHLFLVRSSAGVVLRGAGGNPQALRRAGWSLLRVKVAMYALAGFFGVLSGLCLVGLTTSADANIALRYTLLSIAGVILGGGEFTGGRVSPVGAVIGALTLTLAGSLLSFLRISPDWQIGAQGAILIVVLALRALVNQTERRMA